MRSCLGVVVVLGCGWAVFAGPAPESPPPEPRINLNATNLAGVPNLTSVAVGDFNKDGKLDFATSALNEVLWFEMPGRTRRVIKKAGAALDNVMGLAHEALDVDGDSNLDLLSLETTKTLVWYEGPTPATTEDWKRHLIADNLASASELAVGDTDADGKPELVVHGTDGLLAFKPPANAKADPKWEPRVLSKEVGGALHALQFADVNGDQRMDLMAASASEGTVNWWNAATNWKRHTLATGLAGISDAALADLDDDGRSDLVVALGHSAGLFWYRRGGPAPARPKPPLLLPGPRLTVVSLRLPNTSNPPEANSPPPPAKAAPDRAVTGHASRPTSARPASPPARTNWERTTIDAEFKAPHGLVVADFDNDGKPDLATISRQTRQVAWWENLGDGKFLRREVPTQVHGYQLKLVDFGPPTGRGWLAATRESNAAMFFQITMKSPPAKGKAP